MPYGPGHWCYDCNFDHTPDDCGSNPANIKKLAGQALTPPLTGGRWCYDCNFSHKPEDCGCNIVNVEKITEQVLLSEHPAEGSSCTCPLCVPEKYMISNMFDELCESIREAGNIRALLRVVRAAEAVDEGRISQGYNAVPQTLLDELAKALEALPKHLKKVLATEGS